MEFIRPDISIKFDKIWTPAAVISGLLVVLSICVVFWRVFIAKNFNWGIDFTGGTELHLKFNQGGADLGKVRETMAGMGYPNAAVLSFGDQQQNEILIRVKETSSQQDSVSSRILAGLKKTFGENAIVLLQVDEVGPKVGRDLKLNAFLALLLANVGIFIYIWFRFTRQFAPGAILALVHDVMISLGAFALLNYEFDLSTIAALLTIVGYSTNDTLVIYDRVRENMKKARTGKLSTVVSKSLNETLGRTLMTSFLTLIVVVSLYACSVGGLREFAFVLIVGIISGSSSTIFVATPCLVWLENKKA